MNYPDWAPKNLVAIHLLSRLEKPDRRLDTGFHTELDTEQTIVQIRKECNEVSDQLIEKIRADLSLWSLFPPEKEKERTEILEKLITDQRMKAVWASIARRVEIELEFVHFWTICGAMNRNGLPCQCKLLLRGGKCKFHGGMSTGPRTQEGKEKSMMALRSGWLKWRTKVIKKVSSP